MAQFKDTTINGTLTSPNVNVTGSTTVGGVDLKTKFDLADTLNSKLTKIFGTYYTLSPSKAAKTNWTISSVTSYLYGDVMFVYFAGTRSAAVSGNITNEDVVTITIDTGGKVVNAFTATVNSSSTGGNASWQFNADSISGGVVTITVRLSAVAQSGKEFNAIALMPIRIDPNKY